MNPAARLLARLALILVVACLASPSGGGPAAATTALSRATAGAARALAAGRWEEVVSSTEAAMRVPSKSLPGVHVAETAGLRILRAEALRLLGRDDQAQSELTFAYRANPANLAIAGALLELLRSDSPPHPSPAELDPHEVRADLHQVWRSGRWSAAKLDDVLAMVELARQENRWADANRLLHEATRSFPKDPRPNRVWGELLLEKHAARDAEASFRAALAIDPDDAAAHLGVARAVLEMRYDVALADGELGKALAKNPRLPAALFVQGELDLDAEENAKVDELAARLRASNPRSWQGAALRAARALLAGDDDGYQVERTRVAGQPMAGHFYAFIAEALGRHRRYEVSARVGEDCRRETAAYAPCLSALGTTALRLGQESQGLEALRAAFALDPFDERVFNQLELFEKTIPARYETLERGPFRFRVPKGRRAALDLAIAPFLDETFRAYRDRYRYEPRLPISVELYADHATYAIRVVGTPELAVSAVCFGRVIAAEMPPSPGSNWGLVLAHELAHVFALGLSDNRVPRWFTEGLADHEASRLRPEWRRHQGRLIWSALSRQSLPAMSELSRAFVLASSPDEALLAYVLSTRAIAFLEANAGFPALRAALIAFGQGSTEAEVLTSLGHGAPAELDRAFTASLRRQEIRFDDQALPLEARLAPPLPDFGEARLAPSERVRRTLGEGLRALEKGDDFACRAAEAKLAGGADAEARASAAFLMASRLLADGDTESAYRALAVPLSEGTVRDGYDVRRLLAEAAFRSGRLDAAELQIRRAIALDAERAEPRRFLARLVVDMAERPSPVKVEVLRGLLAVDPTEGARAKLLVAELGRLGDDKGLLEAEPFARFTDPSDPLVSWREGQAARALGQKDRALAAFERALAFGPPAALVQSIEKAVAEIRTPPASKK